MKKYFFILSLLCLALVSCENDEPVPEPVKDPLDYTLVHITESGTYSKITGVYTVDGYNNTVEIGIYPGNYYVKKNSTIRINWNYRNSYSEYNGDYSEEFTVGNAQEIWINVTETSAYVINGD